MSEDFFDSVVPSVSVQRQATADRLRRERRVLVDSFAGWLRASQLVHQQIALTGEKSWERKALENALHHLDDQMAELHRRISEVEARLALLGQVTQRASEGAAVPQPADDWADVPLGATIPLFDAAAL